MLLRSSSVPILGSFVPPQPDVAKESDIATASPVAYNPPPSPSPCRSSISASHFSSSNSLIHSPPVDSPRRAFREHEGDSASQTWLRRAQSESDLATLSSGNACVCAANSLVGSSPYESESVSEDTSSCNKQWAKRKSSQHRGSAAVRQASILEERESVESEREDDDRGSAESPDESIASVERHRASDLSDGGKHSRRAAPETVSLPHTGVGFPLNDGEIYTTLSADADGLPLACNSRGCRPLTRLESEKLASLLMSSGMGLGIGGGQRGGSSWNCQGWGGCSDSNDTDARYQSLLKADPLNPLLLRNYAQYLNEVKGDRKRSEEYFGRAILARPDDGDVLAQYAKFQWDVHRDQERAETYFDRAVQAAPDDCYVMASYASFLWDSEDSEDIIPSSPTHPTLHGASSASDPVLTLA